MAAAVSIGAGFGQSGAAWVVIGITSLAVAAKRWTAAFFILCGLAAGLAAQARHVEGPDVSSATTDRIVVAVTDPAPADRGWAFVVRDVEGRDRIAVVVSDQPIAMAGDTLRVFGSLRRRPGRLHRNDVVGWLTVRNLEVLVRADGWMGAANSVRARVHALFPDESPSSALMQGFLIGDTSAISPIAINEMKRAGLVHFVAVSGGNVALFLSAVWLVLGLVPLGPRQRAALGLAAVFLFVLVTRWEPSVVRAGLMMSLVLGGRIVGVPLGGWAVLGAALTVALLVSPELLMDVGFQLSVVATAGLMLGSRLFDGRRPRIVWRALAATFSAQLAVSPLLIASFGSVPAFSALINLLAAPLVALATAIGWAATFSSLDPVAAVASAVAGVVLTLSSLATALPQVGAVGVVGVVACAVILLRRPALGSFAVAALLVMSLLPATPIPGPVVVFLDVGQGDATILRSGSGAVIAVDTGSDPIVYADALRRHGVSDIDLLVLTHSDQDHVGGIGALAGRIAVDRVWRPAFTADETWADLRLEELDAPVDSVRAGVSVEIDGVRISVIGPGRRFAADNDGSIVLWVESNGLTALLSGDVEAVAQRELSTLRPDVLLVPHHGSQTTDVEWLMDTVGRIAVLSYGLGNQFGHPAGAIVDALDRAGVTVLETASGDVVVPLHRDQLVSLAAVAQRRPKLHGVDLLV